jgi:rhodanese-related sulfurtransferase
LSKREAAALRAAGPLAVLDLAPELATPGREAHEPYLHLPVLDFTSPTAQQLQQALAFIAEHRTGRRVYVHCALGYLRSVSVAAALLRAQGRSWEDIDAVLRTARSASVMPEYVRETLHDFFRAGPEALSTSGPLTSNSHQAHDARPIVCIEHACSDVA